MSKLAETADSKQKRIVGAKAVGAAVLTQTMVEATGDLRRDEIVLDHALDQSSNVASPEEDTSINSNAEVSEHKTKIEGGRPEPEGTELEDDFFAMNQQPVILEPKKKKRKKKRHSTVSPSDGPQTPSLSTAIATTTRANTESPATPEIPVIILDDEDTIEVPPTPSASNPTIPALKRPITPPPMDEATFKAMYRQQHQSDELPERQSSSEDFKKRLALLEGRAASLITNSFNSTLERSSSSEGADYNRNDSRVLQVIIRSFLPGTDQKPALTMAVKAHKKASTVLSKTLSYLKELDDVPARYLYLYDESMVCLFWNKVELKPYMRLNALKLDDDLEEVTLSLYTKDQVRQSEELDRLEKIKKAEERRKEEELDHLLQQETEEIVDDDLDAHNFEDIDSRPVELPVPVAQKPDEGIEYFKIGMKGEDNHKVTVEVHSGSKISDLVKHYLNIKKLDLNSKVTVVFDDEQVSLSDTVGDTELEDGFELDMHVN